MKELALISGKGGTGKTVISAAFAALAQKKILVDCDVDAANLYLLLHPQIQEEHYFIGGKKARVDLEACTGCGMCLEVCRFSAIFDKMDRKVRVDPISCEGCGVCSFVCPVGAIQMENTISGKWFVSSTKYGPFVHARLGIGEGNSGKLVTELRKKAREIAEREALELVIIDGPPGIGCPVIASLSGADLVLVVTEPTLSGIHDMERVISVTRHFRAQPACCINKFDLNHRMTGQIEEWCEKNSVPLVGKIPFSESVIQSLVQGIPATEFSENSATEEIKRMWQTLSSLLTEEG